MAKKQDNFSDKAVKGFDKILDATKEGVNATKKSVDLNKLTESKVTILALASLVFPAGGFMLYFQMKDNKQTAKAAKIYLAWAVGGVFLYFIGALLRMVFRLF